MDAHRLSLALSVVVIRGTGYNPKKRTDSDRLAVEKDLDEIRTLAHLLCDVIPGSDSAWMEWPVVSFAFIAEKDVLGEVGLLSDGRWAHHTDVDLEIRDPAALASWLDARGVWLS